MKDHYFYVHINHNWLDEEKMCQLAKKYRGEASGSGSDFNTRDNSFSFKTEKKAREFYRHMKRFKGVRYQTLSKCYIIANTEDEILESS